MSMRLLVAADAELPDMYDVVVLAGEIGPDMTVATSPARRPVVQRTMYTVGTKLTRGLVAPALADAAEVVAFFGVEAVQGG